MSDAADKSAELQESFNRSAVDYHLKTNILSVAESADNCLECGLQIPSARQLAMPGCLLCVDCAAECEVAR